MAIKNSTAMFPSIGKPGGGGGVGGGGPPTGAAAYVENVVNIPKITKLIFFR